jgi:hypothetical protein
LQIPSRVAAKESLFGKRDSVAPSGAYGFFARFPQLALWAIIFHHSVIGFRVHFQKLICAPGSFFTQFPLDNPFHQTQSQKQENGWAAKQAIL